MAYYFPNQFRQKVNAYRADEQKAMRAAKYEKFSLVILKRNEKYQLRFGSESSMIQTQDAVLKVNEWLPVRRWLDAHGVARDEFDLNIEVDDLIIDRKLEMKKEAANIYLQIKRLQADRKYQEERKSEDAAAKAKEDQTAEEEKTRTNKVSLERYLVPVLKLFTNLRPVRNFIAENSAIKLTSHLDGLLRSFKEAAVKLTYGEEDPDYSTENLEEKAVIAYFKEHRE